ncbi:MAG: wax ester/triacylglycerol synthase family O-acyltransferase [Candidatus Dormibacteraeota bacterium]|nr:wax ester/triacylglycerol synthase family O-acyltransferase [Candidatus Dormibacteraeota bacterium]
MSPQDASFLYIEDANNPMHVGSVALFEGPPPSYGDLVRMVVRKLHLVPRYRQKVRFPPLEMGRPVWVDDRHFQVLYHVRHTAVPPPGGDEELRNLAGRVFAQLLDRTKPLWELWLVQGLPDGRWAMVQKVHHCMVDGIASTDLMSIMFETTPQARLPAPVPWSPRPEPTLVQLTADALADGMTAPLTHLRSLPMAARAPLPSIEWALALARAAAQRPALPRPRTPSSLNGPIGPHRRWSWVKSSLDEIRQIKGSLGGSVNDVVLSVITRGFRELLLARGEPVEGRVVRTLVPVSVRAPSERGTLNNRVSGVFPELPVGVQDPLQRLEDIRRQMDGLKESRQAVAGDALVRLSGFTPSMWLSLGARLGARLPQRLVQTVTTNVPGPQQPLYANGRRMLECYPYVPIGGRIRVGIAIFSYAGGLTFGLTGDYDTMPDLEVLGRGIEEGISELRQLAERRDRRSSGRAPTRRRAPRRRVQKPPD